MANKAVKIDYKLYKNILNLIKKSEYKYRYPSISSFVNEAIYAKLKEAKQKGIFNIKI